MDDRLFNVFEFGWGKRFLEDALEAVRKSIGWKGIKSGFHDFQVELPKCY